MSFLIEPPFPTFQDTDGTPLEGGKIYIGTVNLNPITNPVTVYWDSALTIPVAQPIRTSGGYPVRNGTAGRIFSTSSYSILVRNSNDVLVYSTLNAGITGLVSGIFSGTVSDLNFDPTVLGMVTDEVRFLVSIASPTNPPDVAGGNYYILQLAKVSSSDYRLTMTQASTPGNMYIRSFTSGAWQAWTPVGSGYIALSGGSSPYTLVAWTYDTLLIDSVANPFVLNLPAGTACQGYRIKIVNRSSLSTGLIKIVPSAGNKLGTSPVGEAIYLANMDEAGWYRGEKEVVLISDGGGTWSVSGQWMPSPPVAPNGPAPYDAAGTQYFLGPLRRLSTSNSSNTRTLINQAPPAVVAFSGPFLGANGNGVPQGAKALLMRVIFKLVSVAGGDSSASIAFSDNNTTTPQEYTAHPVVHMMMTAAGAASKNAYACELVVPLNGSGQFYMYSISQVNYAGTSNILAYALGYYMGV